MADQIENLRATIGRSIQVKRRTRKGVYIEEIRYNTEKFPELIQNPPGTGVRAFLPAAIEFGHAAPYQAGGAKVTPERPFYRSSFDQNREAMADEWMRQVDAWIKKQWAS